jgi:hypothetical protein
VLLGASLTPDEITAMFMTGAIPSLDGRLRLISAAMFVVSSALSRFCKRREGTA